MLSSWFSPSSPKPSTSTPAARPQPSQPPDNFNLQERLYQYCKKGDEAEVLFLLEAGVDPNFMSREKRTPLHIAVSRTSNRGIVYALIAHGASCVAFDGAGCTPMHVMASPDYVRIFLETVGDLDTFDRNGAQSSLSLYFYSSLFVTPFSQLCRSCS